jgi:hypothetical protein
MKKRPLMTGVTVRLSSRFQTKVAKLLSVVRLARHRNEVRQSWSSKKDLQLKSNDTA